MASQTEINPEIHFAQRLAANDKTTRDRAIKKLRQWLSKKGDFTEVELLKIWKGLHYCMWMQDKPLLQEELADNISQLVHVFDQTEISFLFIQTFFQTEAREWSSIDRWRIDKFMMLVRRMLKQALLYLKNHKWKKSRTKMLIQIVKDRVINSECDGLKIHLSDIYMEELENVGAEVLSSDQVLQFMEPFLTFLPTAENIAVVKRTISRMLTDAIIKQTVNDAMLSAEKQIQKEEEDSEDNEEENSDLDLEDDSEQPSRLQFDFEKIANRLFDLGSRPDCIARNRVMIYDVVKKLRDLQEGILPVDEEVSDVSDEEIDNNEINQAIQRLVALEKNVDTGGKKKKKNRKRKLVNKVLENTDEKENSLLHDSSTKTKKQKTYVNDSGETIAAAKTKKKTGKRKSSDESRNDTLLENVKIPNKKQKMAEKFMNNNMDVSKKSKNKNKSEVDNFTLLKDMSAKGDDSCIDKNRVGKKQKHRESKTKENIQNGDNSHVDINGSVEKQTNMENKNKKQLLSRSKISNDENKNVTPKSAAKLRKKSEVKNSTLLKENSKKGDNWDVDANSVVEKQKSVKGKNKKQLTFTPNVLSDGKEIVTPKSVTKIGKKSKRFKISDSENSVLDNSELFSEKGATSKLEKSEKTEDKSSVNENEEMVKKKKRKDKNIPGSNAQTDSSEIHINDTVGIKSKKQPNTVSNPPFAQFEKLEKTPPAFVRKAMSKLSTPKTEPRKVIAKKLHISTPGSAPPGKRKSVSFNMKSNTTLDFHNDVHLSPGTPFNPKQKPETSILKMSVTPSPARSRVKGKGHSKMGQSSGKTSTPLSKNRPTAADFF